MASEDNLMRIGKRCYVSNLAWRTSWQARRGRGAAGHRHRAPDLPAHLLLFRAAQSAHWRRFSCLQDLKDKFRDCGTVVYANVTRGDDGGSPYGPHPTFWQQQRSKAPFALPRRSQ